MSKTKHTPTPYKIGRVIDEGAIRIDAAEDEPFVAIVRFSDHPARTKAIAIATAEFIVRAANCHDELVAGIKSAANELAYNNGADSMILRVRGRLCALLDKVQA